MAISSFSPFIKDPPTDDGASLGSTSLNWSDLYLASGGVINWIGGDVAVTHASNSLAFAGATSGYDFDRSVTIGGTNTTPMANGRTLVIDGTNSANSQPCMAYYMPLSTDKKVMGFVYDDGTNLGGNPGLVTQQLSDSGSFVANTGVAWRDGAMSFGTISYPGEGGSISLQNNLYLGSGKKIDFNAGNVTVTHSTGTPVGNLAFTSTVTLVSTVSPAANGSKVATFCSSGIGVYVGTGVASLSAGQKQGSLYIRTDGSTTITRIYIATSTATSSSAWASLTASS